MEENAESDAKRWVAQNRTSLAALRSGIQQIETATGDQYLHGDSPTAIIEAYAKLARLWATGTRQGGVGAATQQDAREQRRRLKASGAPLTQLLQETMDFFREVLKQTSRLMKAKRAGKLGDLEGFLNESLGLTEEAAHVAGVEQEVQRMNVDMATFSLGSKISESKAVGLVRLWQAVANVGEVFQYGKTKSPLHTDIEKAVETPKQPLSMSFYGGQSQLRVTGKNGHLDVMAANTDHPYINSIDADSAGDSGGGGSQLYQAALDWIHNNGKQIRDDPQGLSEINAVRRTSNFFASALRWGTTKHLKPHTHQGVPWSNTSDIKNIESLAVKEMDNAFKAIEQARKWRYDFINERFINESGKELNEDDFREAVMVGDPATSGIGLSTLQRAVLIASALEADERGVLESIIHAGIDSGRVNWPLRGVTYSLSLSDRLEALSAALGEQVQAQPEQQPALLQRAREHLATEQATWAAQPTSTSAQQQALRSLDAVLTVLPPEARAQLGGFLQLSSLSTAAARQTEIEKRFTQLTDYLAQPPATQAGDASSSDPLVQTSEAAQADSGDAHSESDAPIAFSRERFDKDMELPYWTEYYKKVGRQGDDLSSLLSNLQKQGIEVEESNDAGLSEIRDKSGKVTGYKINYGSKTKKWEMLEEYSHWRVRYGWKKSEIQALE